MGSAEGTVGKTKYVDEGGQISPDWSSGPIVCLNILNILSLPSNVELKWLRLIIGDPHDTGYEQLMCETKSSDKVAIYQTPMMTSKRYLKSFAAIELGGGNLGVPF